MPKLFWWLLVQRLCQSLRNFDNLARSMCPAIEPQVGKSFESLLTYPPLDAFTVACRTERESMEAIRSNEPTDYTAGSAIRGPCRGV